MRHTFCTRLANAGMNPKALYATFNMQASFNADLTSEGFHQGGLSAGVTNMSNWEFYNGYYSVCPCDTQMN